MTAPKRQSLVCATVLSLLCHWAVLRHVVFVPVPAPIEPGEPIVVFEDDKLADVDLDPDLHKTRPFVMSEEAGRRERPPGDAPLGPRDQTVDTPTKARHGETFRAADDGGDPQGEPRPHETLSMKDLSIDPLVGAAPGGMPSRTFDGSTLAENGPAATNDLLPGIAAGPRTVLSTREYRFHAYLNRIHRAVTRPWRIDVQRRAEGLWLVGRPLKLGQEMTTKVAVTLDAEGSLVDVAVVKSSGSRTIDHAGELAFRRIGKFPNPPEGMVGEDGRIHLRWQFVMSVVPTVAEMEWQSSKREDTRNN